MYGGQPGVPRSEQNLCNCQRDKKPLHNQNSPQPLGHRNWKKIITNTCPICFQNSYRNWHKFSSNVSKVTKVRFVVAGEDRIIAMREMKTLIPALKRYLRILKTLHPNFENAISEL